LLGGSGKKIKKKGALLGATIGPQWRVGKGETNRGYYGREGGEGGKDDKIG